MTNLVAAFGGSIEVSEHASVEDALAFMNSPEMLAQSNTYMSSVQSECERDLSEADRALFRRWWAGGGLPSDFWESIGTGPAYCAIMQATSMGCG